MWFWCVRSLMKQHLQQSPFRSTSMQLNSSDSLLTGLNGSVSSVQLASQDRFPSELDLEVLSGSFDCDMDTITRNDLMDADGLEFSFDSHLISSQNANLTSESFSRTKRTSSQSWVPGWSGQAQECRNGLNTAFEPTVHCKATVHYAVEKLFDIHWNQFELTSMIYPVGVVVLCFVLSWLRLV